MPSVFRRSWTDPRTGEKKTSRWWFIRYTDAAGHDCSERTDPPTSSKRVALEQLEAALRRQPAAAGGTVGALLDAYLGHLKVNANSTYRSRRYWIEWWREELGAKTPAAAVTPELVTKGTAKLIAKGLAAGSLEIHLGALRAAFRYTHKEHPVASMPITFRSAERHVTWSDEEIARVLSHLPPWVRAVVELLACTGLRVGETLALRWEHVRKDTLVWRSEKPNKTLTKPLGPEAQRILDALPRTSDWIFPARGGKVRRSKRAYDEAWRVAREVAEVKGKTTHDLRRTYATVLYNRGVSPALIAALLGQASTRLVPRYTHAELETLRAADALAQRKP